MENQKSLPRSSKRKITKKTIDETVNKKSLPRSSKSKISKKTIGETVNEKSLPRSSKHKITKEKIDETVNEKLLPRSSKRKISKKKIDETVNEKCSKTFELTQLPVIPSSIIEDRVKSIVTGKASEDIYPILTQQCSFKFAEVFKAATDYMEQCGRMKFTIEDFNKGLSCCGEKPVMSYDIPPPKKKRRYKPKKTEESEDVYQNVYIKELWLNGISPFSTSINNLSDELQNYFNAFKEVIFLNDEKTSIIVKNMQTNKNIFQLVPYFVNFFCDAMIKFAWDFSKVLILLRFLSALLKNVHLYFGQDSYLNSVSRALLMFLATDLPHFIEDNDCWSMKDIAANLLSTVVMKSKDHHLFFDAIHFMKIVLSFPNPLNSHYGALVALNSIGVPAIVLLLPSYNDELQEHVKMAVYSTKEKVDFHMVQGQVVRSYYRLARFYYKNEFNKTNLNPMHHLNSTNFLRDYLKDANAYQILSHSSFSDFYGEALHPTFPLLNFSSSSFSRKKPKSSLKSWKKSKTCLNSHSENVDSVYND